MKKNVYYLMAVLSGILFSMVLRYPMVPHEQGWDTQEERILKVFSDC